MSHYAKVTDGIVTQVIVAEPEFFDTFVDTTPGEWLKTSYTGSIRKNFAGVGFSYDATKDAYIPPQPFNSWVLNDTSCVWEAPIPIPDDTVGYQWNEETKSWDAEE